MSEPMTLCPTCRVAIPDRVYHAHSKKCQAEKAAERGDKK